MAEPEVTAEINLPDQANQNRRPSEDIEDDVDLDSIDITKYKLDDDDEEIEEKQEEDQPDQPDLPTPVEEPNQIIEESQDTSNNTPVDQQSDGLPEQSHPDALSSRSSSSSSISATQFNAQLSASTVSNTTSTTDRFNQHVYNNTNHWAQNVGRTVRHLHDSLHEASNTTLEFVKAYKLATEQIHDTIDQNVVSVHQLVTKAQSLNEELRGVEMLHQQVKETKKLLNFLEDAVNNLTKVPRK